MTSEIPIVDGKDRISDAFSTFVVPQQIVQEEHKAILSCRAQEDFLLSSAAPGNPSCSVAHLFHAVFPCLVNSYRLSFDTVV